MDLKDKKFIKVFEISEQKFWGTTNIIDVNDWYDEWRNKGYGVLIDSEGCICVDKEDSEDDGLYWSEQIKNL